jgi:hypothetical protein
VARINLDWFFIHESKVGIEMDIVIKEILRNALSAKRDKIGDALLELVNVAIFDPRGKLFIDRNCPFLEDERRVVEIEGMDHFKGVVKGDRRISVLGRMEMEGKKSRLGSEMIEGDLIALEVPVSFPGDFFDSFLPKWFEFVEKGKF